MGSEQGKLFLYRVTEDAVFEEVGYLWEEICFGMPESFGMHSAAAVADLNGDGVLEMVVGNFAGGLQLFNGNIAVNQGVEEVSNDSFKVFPNPAKGQITIEGSGRLTITNLLGQTVVTKEIHGSETVDLPCGIWLVRLNGITRKVLVE